MMKNMKLIMIALTFIAAMLLLPVMGHAQETKNDLPVRIYLLVGQSNMQGKAGIDGIKEIVKKNPKEFKFLVNDDGSYRERQDVWIHYEMGPASIRYGLLKPGYGSSGGLIGPELGFGHKIGDAYDGQVLLIKAAWGGKSLGHNFLPPSVGKYPKPARNGDPGFYYHEILRLVKKVTENIKTFFPDYKGQGVEFAGLCFHQGWNDQYGDLPPKYEKNLAAFIKDIRSKENGVGVPKLPVVIATSGNIMPETPVKDGQKAMGDKTKYPEFSGNVSVVDTEKPYGPDKMQFRFYTKKTPDKVGYHWNRHAASYVNMGRAMASEMKKMVKPKLPSRLAAYGTSDGVQLTWQLGSEEPKNIKLLRNGKKVEAKLSPKQTTFVDTAALPGKNSYELIIGMQTSTEQKLTAECDTSISKLTAYRSMEGVMLNWQARGKYDGFKLLRDGKMIAENISGEVRSYEDKEAPAKGLVKYAIQPTTGTSTPATLTVNRGPIDPGDALLYEPFDYPADPGKPQTLLGKSGTPGTKGEYQYLSDKKLERAPATLAGGLSYSSLPVAGNRGSTHRWSAEGFIELDDSLKKAGLLEDGATLWMSFVFLCSNKDGNRKGGGIVTLRSADMKEGIGFKATDRQYETAVVLNGKLQGIRITGTKPETPILVVGKIVWGKDGENDSFVPYQVGPDLKLPEKPGRAYKKPFNIDQSKLSRLVLGGIGQFDEIRVGPTYESVIGGGTKRLKVKSEE